MITTVTISPARYRAWQRAEKAKTRYLKILLEGDGAQSLCYVIEDWDKTDVTVCTANNIPEGYVTVQCFHESKLAKMWYEAWKRKAGVSIDP